MGDYFRARSIYVDTIAKPTKIIKWFINHSYALGMLKSEEKNQDMRVLTPTLPCHIRWTSHYLSASRMLALKKPMQAIAVSKYEDLRTAAGKKREQKEAAENVLRIIRDSCFWERLKSESAF